MIKKNFRSIKAYRFLSRLKYALSYYLKPLAQIVRWANKDTEDHNFLYRITNLNTLYLVHFIASTFSISLEKSQFYIDEILKDEEFTSDLKSQMRLLTGKKDVFPFLGRRIGWYAVVRILKPKVIFESGVFEGLGAAVVIAAIKRNQSEGFPAEYIGTDITPGSGALISLEDLDFARVIIGDTSLVLEQLDIQIDLFISDGNHASEFEWLELDALNNKLSKNSCVISDNSHVSSVLAEWSVLHGREFFFFKETPEDHWYPGAGIGISLD